MTSAVAEVICYIIQFSIKHFNKFKEISLKAISSASSNPPLQPLP